MERRRTDPRLVAVAVLVHGVVAALTWRDLRARPDDRVRGSKSLWRLASGANTLGSVGYWLVGRRRG